MAIDWLAVGAALLAGLLGGAHCAAMCGGIATGFSASVPQQGLRRALEPNIGRLLGYVVAGALVGAFGHGLLQAARVEGLATALRVGVGALLMVVALRLLDGRGRFSALGAPGNVLWRRLRPLQARLLPADTSARRLGLGMLWGWMPCGLSTSLLAIAWLQADAVRGALTMAAFGLGTLPLMTLLTWSGARIGAHLQSGPLRRAGGMLVLGAGALTMIAPWLATAPGLHSWLAALGCLPAGA